MLTTGRLHVCGRVVLLLGLMFASSGLANPADSLSEYIQRALNTPTEPVVSAQDYTRKALEKKDFAGVIEAWKGLFTWEWRYANWVIRSSFHDCFAVDADACQSYGLNTQQCGWGCDASLVLTAEEMGRKENAYEKFAARVSRAARMIATYYGISIADAIVVGAAEGVEFLSRGRVKVFRSGAIKVGRLDNLVPAPANQLPAPSVDVAAFAKFWEDRGMPVPLAMALMGSHSLVDDQECLVGARASDKCDPSQSSCINVRMFRWENHYFNDICSPKIEISPSTSAPTEPNLATISEEEFVTFTKNEQCKFTSPQYRKEVAQELDLARGGDPSAVDVDPPQPFSVDWTNENCENGLKWGVKADECPHPEPKWFYTVNDAFSGQACQADDPYELSEAQAEVRSAAREYLDQDAWDKAYVEAYEKMTTTYANMPASLVIYGNERGGPGYRKPLAPLIERLMKIEQDDGVGNGNGGDAEGGGNGGVSGGAGGEGVPDKPNKPKKQKPSKPNKPKKARGQWRKAKKAQKML